MSMDTFLDSLLGITLAIPFGALIIKIADYIAGGTK